MRFQIGSIHETEKVTQIRLLRVEDGAVAVIMNGIPTVAFCAGGVRRFILSDADILALGGSGIQIIKEQDGTARIRDLVLESATDTVIL